MDYLLKGRLSAVLCEEFREPLANVLVRVYRAQSVQEAINLNEVQILSEEALKEKAGRLLVESVADEAGYFQVVMHEGTYAGACLELDLVCIGVRGAVVQFTLDRFQPFWRPSDEKHIAAWSLCLPRKTWKQVRGQRGDRALCGHVRDNRSGELVPGVRVTVLGLDWLSGEPVGTAVTDSRGRFSISRLSKELRSKTQPGGVDVYFRVETLHEGEPLFVERPVWYDGVSSEGTRTVDCLMVDLLIERGTLMKRSVGRIAAFFSMPGPEPSRPRSGLGTAGLLMGQ